ncbi:MAG: tetratricopeptide repeat protein, partial [Verrucomicrobiia bacterium]
VLCNQGDAPGSSEVWNAVVRLSGELIHVVTEQPYKVPGKARISQEQRMYRMVKTDGVEAAIEWFKAKGRKAAWGGSNSALAQQLIKDGRADDGLRLMELDIELTPGKVWMLRRTAEAYLSNGHPRKALIVLNKGLELKPDDDRLKAMKVEADQDLKGK